MTWIWVLLVVVVLGVTAAVAIGRGDPMGPAHPDRPDVRLPAGRPLVAADLEGLEFSVATRGYRMDEVDDVLARLAHELSERDARTARLEHLLRQYAEAAEADRAGHPDRADRADQSDRDAGTAPERPAPAREQDQR